MQMYLPPDIRGAAQTIGFKSTQQRLRTSLAFFKEWEAELLEREAKLHQNRRAAELKQPAGKVEQVDVFQILNSEVLRKEEELKHRQLQVLYREKMLSERELRFEQHAQGKLSFSSRLRVDTNN